MPFFDSLVKAVNAGIEVYDTARYGEDVPYEDMLKAVQGSDPSTQKNLVSTQMPQATDEMPRALFHDPYSIMDWGGWRERPSAVTYESLRQMAVKNTAVAAIINLRSNQISQFTRPQQNRYDRGFKIVLRDRRDKKRSMTDQEARQAAEIERMLETTAVLLPDEKPADRDTFKAFIKKGVRDILTYDQWCFEKIRDRTGRISRFVALPSETIRPAVTDLEHMSIQEKREHVSHVQVYEDTVIAEFAPDDIAWCCMNPRSDLRVNTFGFSPLEQLINLVTSWLFGFEYNTRFFTQGSAVKGVLNIKGAIPDRQLRAFRRLWYSMVSGVQNSWRTPILNSDDIQWINMHSSNREMEFSAWMDWITKLICAVYGVDPIEINFQFGNTGQTSGLAEGSMEYKIVESKDKGLRPLMEFIAECINLHVIWDINPDLEFAFTGLDAKEEETERKGLMDEVQNYKTVNEVRAQLDDEPLPDGDVILNTVYVQASQQAQMEQQGDEGDGSPLDMMGDEDDEDDFDQDQGRVFGIPGSEKDQGDQEVASKNTEAFKSLTDTYESLQKARLTRRISGSDQIITIDLPDRSK
jgi:phage portal protein BeeE